MTNVNRHIVLFGLAALLAACSTDTGQNSPTGQTSQAVSQRQQSTAVPLPTRVVVAETSVAVDGVLTLAVPQIALGFEQNGKVISVKARLGQMVKQGDTLAAVDDIALQDAVIDAQMQIDTLNATIAQQLTPATKEELAAAQAALTAAYISYNTTKSGTTVADLATAQASLESAKNSYLSAQASRDQACASSTTSIGCQSAEAAYGNAYESMVAAQKKYDVLLQPVTRNTLTQAYSSVASAKAKIDSLKTGVSEQQQKVNQAQIDQATAALARVKANLSKATLLSPCACVVQAVNIAVGARSSGTAFVLVDLAKLQFQTTNLTERDVANVKVGAVVTVRLKAHSKSFSGKVSTVLGQSSGTQSGTALYTVVIALDPITDKLLPGMTGQAEIALG